MLRKIFAYVSIVGCLIAFAQCMKDSYKDVVGWELRWEGPQPFDNPLPHLDVTEVVTCSVHTEQAVYLLNPDGKCWKFTQASAGVLEHVSIANVPDASGKPLFAFPAGPADAQKLHVGIVDQDQKQVKIQQYNGTAWKPAGSYQFESEEAAKLKGAACSIRNEDGGLNGLIILAHSDPKKSVLLRYNSANEKLKATDRWDYPSNLPPMAAVQIAPTKVLVAREDDRYNQSIVRTEIGKKGLFVVHEGDNPNWLRLFLLQPEKYFKKAVWVLLSVKEGGEKKLEFYTLEGANFEKKAEDLPEETEEEKKEEDDKSDKDDKNVEASKATKEEKEKINHEQSLILPFPDAVYVLARTVYWKGSLKAPESAVE